MLRLIERAISAHTMLDGVAEVTVAVSGGADSVALLHAMLSLRETYGITVYAAHLNHALRGAESDADAQFVSELCHRWNVPLFAEKTDVAAIAAERGQGIELAARNVRYAFLQRVAKGRIATAHTADDNAETVLLHITRGAGLNGVCGIPPVRGNIIRPLIYCTRAQVEAYCAEYALDYRIDSSNADLQYARNRIRQTVLPQLRRINSGCVRNISRMAETLRTDADYLDTVAQQKYAQLVSSRGLPVAELQKLHKALLSRVLLLHCKAKTGHQPDAKHLQSMLQLLEKGTSTQLSGRLCAVKAGGYLDLDTASESPTLYKELGADFENLQFPGLKFIYCSAYSKKINNLVFKNSFDCAKIKGKLVIRHRLGGDTLCPAGRGCTKTLKKLCNEAHLPRSQRGLLRILADEQGIVWAEGFGVDARVCVTEHTRSFVTVECTDTSV